MERECVMSTYVVIDFETNGLPEQKGEKQACLYYLQSYVNEKNTKCCRNSLAKKIYRYNQQCIQCPCNTYSISITA